MPAVEHRSHKRLNNRAKNSHRPLRRRERAVPGPTDYEQIPDLAHRARTQMQQFFETMDRRLAEGELMAGAQYTIADITTLVAVDFAGWAKLTVPPHCTNLLRWYATVSARPSAKA